MSKSYSISYFKYNLIFEESIYGTEKKGDNNIQRLFEDILHENAL
jgi:hypothetical protein